MHGFGCVSVDIVDVFDHSGGRTPNFSSCGFSGENVRSPGGPLSPMTPHGSRGHAGSSKRCTALGTGDLRVLLNDLHMMLINQLMVVNTV